MDSRSLALVLTTIMVVLASLASPGWLASTGLAFLYGGANRSRNVVIRAGERGSGVV